MVDTPDGLSDYAPSGMSTDLRDRLLTVFARTRDRQVINTVSVLSASPDRARWPEHIIADAATLVNNLVDESPAKTDYACTKGCLWCCHQQVRITPPEAIAIAEALRESFPSDWLEQLLRILKQRVDRIGGFNDQTDYLRAKLPCAFLGADGACGIYAWRPIVCRGYHSLSREACQDKYIDVTAPAPPIDSFAHMAANAVLHGVSAAVHAANMDWRQYEMHGVVLRALEIPDAAVRWAAGENIFAGCRLSAADRPA